MSHTISKYLRSRFFHKERIINGRTFISILIIGIVIGVCLSYQIGKVVRGNVDSQTYISRHNNLYINPNDLLKTLKSSHQDSIIIDVRPERSYKQEHIRTALNIPVQTGEKIVSSSLKEIDKKKDIIIYGENQFSLEPYLLAEELLKKGRKVRVLRIGWNEFRNFPTFWLPESEWDITLIFDYIEGDQISPQ